jgi:hypothetical protein
MDVVEFGWVLDNKIFNPNTIRFMSNAVHCCTDTTLTRPIVTHQKDVEH